MFKIRTRTNRNPHPIQMPILLQRNLHLIRFRLAPLNAVRISLLLRALHQRHGRRDGNRAFPFALGTIRLERFGGGCFFGRGDFAGHARADDVEDVDAEFAAHGPGRADCVGFSDAAVAGFFACVVG